MTKRIPLAFASVLVLVTASLVGVVFLLQKPSQVTPPSPDMAALGVAYTVSMRDIVSDYRKTETAAAAKVAESRMLNLTVPAEHRGFHLDLVLALHRFSTSTAKTAKATKEAVSAILSSTAWLN